MRIIPAVEGFPMAVPRSVCYLCGCGPHENDTWILDTEQIVDMEGQLMFCEHCVADMAHLFNYYSQDQIKKLRSYVAKIEAEIREIRRDRQRMIDGIMANVNG